MCDIADVDECESDPCKNGGSCVDHPNKYSCDCVQGYTEYNCATGIVS